ncbi:MAG: VCBS repeat-containing protein [Verrucomicrobiales bacterium]
MLHPGENTIAVEVHQAAVTSSDLGFDFRLSLARPVFQRLERRAGAIDLGIHVGQFNNDGLEDVISGCYSCFSMTLFEGRNQAEGLGAPQPIPVPGLFLASGDLDGDGIDEILHSSQRWGGEESRVFLAHLDPVAGWQDVTYLPDAGFGAMSGVSLADIDGDGHLDIVTGGHSGTPAAYFVNEGALQFSQPVLLSDDITKYFSVLGTGDFDGNGLQDIMYANNDGFYRPSPTPFLILSPCGSSHARRNCSPSWT